LIKKEVIRIFMFSIDLTVADDSIRATCVNGRLARDRKSVLSERESVAWKTGYYWLLWV